MTEPYEFQPEDVEYLNSNYPSQWRKITEGTGKNGLVIEAFSVPSGYNETQTKLLVLIPNGYPGAALDMFYFSPPLAKSDGSSIAQLAMETHFGENWQRWSRHYDWIAGEDSLIRHIEFVWYQLQREIEP